jgi:hypothetical protein
MEHDSDGAGRRAACEGHIDTHQAAGEAGGACDGAARAAAAPGSSQHTPANHARGAHGAAAEDSGGERRGDGGDGGGGGGGSEGGGGGGSCTARDQGELTRLDDLAG